MRGEYMIAVGSVWTCPETGWSVGTDKPRRVPSRVTTAMTLAMRQGKIKPVVRVHSQIGGGSSINSVAPVARNDSATGFVPDEDAQDELPFGSGTHSVAEAIQIVMESGDESALTADGVPTTEVLSKIVGRRVSAAERDEALAEMDA